MAQGQAPPNAAWWFGCTGPGDAAASHKVDCNWPGKNRQVLVAPRDDPPSPGETGKPDYLGVYIRAEHSYITGILGDTLTITDSGVNLLEPQGYST